LSVSKKDKGTKGSRSGILLMVIWALMVILLLTSTPIQSQSDEATRNDEPTMHLAFFYDPDCGSCDIALKWLPEVEEEYSNLEVHEYDTSIWDDDTETFIYSEMGFEFADAYNVPSGDQTEPMFFIGEYYLVPPGSTIKEELTDILDIYDGQEIPLWPEWNLTWSAQVALFYDPETPEGEDALEVVDSLDKEHVVVVEYDLSEGALNETLFDEYLEHYNIEEEPEVAVFIGEDAFIDDEITFDDLNDSVFKNPGVNTPLPDIELPDVEGGNICIVVFYSPTCHECNVAMKFLKEKQQEYPEINIVKKSTADRDNEALKHSYYEEYDVPDSKRGGTLAIFMGDDYFTTSSKLKEDFDDLMDKYEGGVPCPDVEEDEEAITDLFKSFSIGVVGLAGLVDGINPCAFATMIFFITYLSSSGRNRKQILAVGISFTVGVFLTYFLLGMGLYSGIQSVSHIEEISKMIYPITGVIALIFGIFSLYDYRKAKDQKKEEQVLQLPKSIKKLTGRFIKHQDRKCSSTILAVFTGVGISALEFLCTGQVYLPTIVYMTGVSEHQSEAALYLLLYNVMFILPLIIIFTSVYYGASSEKLQETLDKRRATIKLLTALMFLGLAYVMFYLSLGLYGLV